MTKRKSVVSKILLLVVLLTLVSCCFLGSTFARYTSGGSGSATLNVAKWAIDIKGGAAEGSTEVSFTDQLSPSMEEYSESPRTNQSGKVLVATVENTGDVDATVSLTVGPEIIFKGVDGKVVGAEDDASTTVFGQKGVATDGTPTEAEVEEVFSIKLYSGTTEGAEHATNDLASGSGTADVPADGGKIYIYAEVTWTSDSATITGATADIRDTWIGKNVTSVGWDLSYTAVQATELP